MDTAEPQARPWIALPSLDQHHLHQMLATFPSMMLSSFEARGGSPPTLRTRPMEVAKLEDDCTLLFVSSIDASKTEDAAVDSEGYAFAQSPTRYVSMRGRFRISRDHARLRRIWSSAMDVWFHGPDDPRACILTFAPIEAEMWDVSGTRGLRYLFGAVKALMTGEKSPVGDREQHAKISLIH